jgi:rhodanese-related sulfurtransferase
MNVNPQQLIEFVGNHWMMAAGLFVVAILLVQDILDSATRRHKTVTPLEAVVLMNKEETLVIDVREPNEYAEGHIDGARNIPLAKLDERAAELESHKQLPILINCQSGTRSLAAGKKLTKLGFTQIFELKGGIYGWKDQNLPLSKKRA